MRTTRSLLVAAALLSAGAAPARGQSAATDSRWLPYLGCWEPIEGSKSSLCVVPAAGTSTVDFVTVFKGQVTVRERIAATGAHIETSSGDCTGWRSAEWSAYGQQLFLRSEDGCPGARARSGTGVIAMSNNGEWLYIQSATVAGQTGLQVQRYRPAAGDVALPGDLDSLHLGISATIAARAAAAAPLGIDDVVEASRKVEAEVLQAWLVERGEPFTLDAKRLIALADAGVPSAVIDLMVALSYPKAFAINPAARQGERRALAANSAYREPVTAIFAKDLFCSSSYLMQPYARYDCFGGGYGYRHGNGWYPGGYPLAIVYTGPPAPPRPHGRMVNGQGYTVGSSGTAQAQPTSGGSSGGNTSGSSSGSSAGSSSGSSGGRTAQPRPH